MDKISLRLTAIAYIIRECIRGKHKAPAAADFSSDEVCANAMSSPVTVADIGCDHGYLGIYLCERDFLGDGHVNKTSNKSECDITPKNGTNPRFFVEFGTHALSSTVNQHIEVVIDSTKDQQTDPIADIQTRGYTINLPTHLCFNQTHTQSKMQCSVNHSFKQNV